MDQTFRCGSVCSFLDQVQNETPDTIYTFGDGNDGAKKFALINFWREFAFAVLASI